MTDSALAHLDSSLDAVMDGLYDLHRHRSADTLPRAVLAALTRAIACDSAILVRIEPKIDAFTVTAIPPDAFANLDHRTVARLHRKDHPLLFHYAKRRDPRAWSLHDFVTQAEFRQSDLYRDLYRPLGIEHQMLMLIPHPDRSPRVIALNRKDRPFEEWERANLERFWQHIVLAFRYTRGASRPRSDQRAEGVYGGRGVVVLDSEGRVQLCTEQARIWLIRYATGTFSQREIRSLPSDVAEWVRAAFSDRTLRLRGIPDPVEPLHLRRSDHYLELRLIVDHGRGQHLILLEEFALHSPPELLLGLGLTAREAEVLSWVAQGKTNRETSVILGLSNRTVQKHMERIFLKLGVETRTGAILKAWQVGRFAALSGSPS